MIELDSRQDQEKVLAAIRNWEEAGVSPLLRLIVGNEDYSDRIPDGDVKQDGIAITLDATFAGHLPLRLYGAPVSLSVSIGGIEVPQLQGLISLPEPNDDMASTKLMAASAGSFADKYPLNEAIEYTGVRPDYVVRDALRRLPYTPGRVEIESVDGPPLYFARGAAEGPFEADQNVNDILSKVAEKVLYVYHDTAWGGVIAHISAGIARVPDVPDFLRFHAEELLFWKSPALVLEQYSQVIVFKKNQDGNDAFKPAVANVQYIGRDYPPQAGTTRRIAYTEDAAGAQKLAYDKAIELGRGLYKSEPVISYNPLLERTDSFIVLENKEEDDAGFYEREWLHYVDAFEHDWGTGSDNGFQTKPSCSTSLLNEQLIKAPTLILGLVSTGVMKTLFELVRWDNDNSGFWLNLPEANPYAGNDSSGFWIDEAASGGLVSNSADGLAFDL